MPPTDHIVHLIITDWHSFLPNTAYPIRQTLSQPTNNQQTNQVSSKKGEGEEKKKLQVKIEPHKLKMNKIIIKAIKTILSSRALSVGYFYY